MFVTGYHGTSLRVARLLCDGISTFIPSVNEGDWLGYGSYFFEDAPQKALTWAQLNCANGDTPAVIRAEIDISKCLDLLDIPDFKLLREYDFILRDKGLPFQEPLEVSRGRAAPPKDGTPLKMRNRRDRFVVDYCVKALEPTREITTVRSAFLWGHALSPQSCIFNWSRVEIAVRDPSRAIKKLTIEKML